MPDEQIHLRMLALTVCEAEQLRSIHQRGPTWDGNISSKDARNALLKQGLIAKVVVKGEDGYQACTYRGARLLREMVAACGGVYA